MLVRIVDEPPVECTTLVAALPDMGNVAGIAIEHLVKVLNMQEFARLAGYWPPYIVYRKGETRFRRSYFSFHKVGGGERFIVMSDDYQPQESSALYMFCEKVMEFAKNLDIRNIITLGDVHRDIVMQERGVFYAASGESLGKQAQDLLSQGFVGSNPTPRLLGRICKKL